VIAITITPLIFINYNINNNHIIMKNNVAANIHFIKIIDAVIIEKNIYINHILLTVKKLTHSD
jgi:hypothetical protein